MKRRQEQNNKWIKRKTWQGSILETEDKRNDQVNNYLNRIRNQEQDVDMVEIYRKMRNKYIQTNETDFA